MRRGRLGEWFPFTATELQIALGAIAFVTTCLALFGVGGAPLGWISIGAIVLIYFAGLITHSRTSGFRLLREGAVQGAGYIHYFRRAKRSLLLLHIDDDAPNAELLGLYHTLLDRGVQLRRVIFVRPDHAPDAYRWIAEFGRHERLKQKVILPEQADVMRMSFVVVDNRWVLLSVPGGAAVDSEGYATCFVLRHLLVVEDSEAADAFTEIHSQLWRRALALDDETLLLAPEPLVQRLRSPAVFIP